MAFHISKTPIVFRNQEWYLRWLTADVEVESVLDVGVGLKGVIAQSYWETEKNIKRGYACDIWAIKELSSVWTPLKVNALELLDILPPRSVDVVIHSGFLEHLTYPDGYKWIEIAEKLARKLVFISAAVFCHGETNDYKVKADGNPYHVYQSAWDWALLKRLGYATNWEDARKARQERSDFTFIEEAIGWKMFAES